MKSLRLFGAAGAVALVSALFIVNPAAAQVAPPSGASVSLPLGVWLHAIAPSLSEILVAGAMFMLRKLPRQIVDILIGLRVDQMAARAVDYGFNSVQGALKGQAVSLDVGNQVVAHALQYFIDHAPEWLVRWAGDVDLIKQKLIARLSVEKDVALK